MDAEIKKEFEDLAVMIGGCFDKVDQRFEKIESQMATKEDLERFATKEELSLGLGAVESRLSAKIDAVRSDVEDVKVAVDKLDARDKADTDALVGDVLELRQKVEAGARP